MAGSSSELRNYMSRSTTQTRPPFPHERRLGRRDCRGAAGGLPQASAAGAQQAGAEAGLLEVQETAPDEAIAANEAWAAHHARWRELPVVTAADLLWADAAILGSPVRFGNAAASPGATCVR